MGLFPCRFQADAATLYINVETDKWSCGEHWCWGTLLFCSVPAYFGASWRIGTEQLHDLQYASHKQGIPALRSLECTTTDGGEWSNRYAR